MAVAPEDANRIRADGLKFVRNHVGIDVVDKHEPLAGDFIDAAGTAAGGAGHAVRYRDLQAVVPGDVQHAGRMVAADALRRIGRIAAHGVYVNWQRAAVSVLCMSMTTVSGPTPRGTGVIALATSRTAS